jgi:hypothetical protein
MPTLMTEWADFHAVICIDAATALTTGCIHRVDLAMNALPRDRCPASMPDLSSSAYMPGAPQSGLATLISRMSLRMSEGAFAPPPRGPDLQRQ